MTKIVWDEDLIADYIQDRSTVDPTIDIYHQVYWVHMEDAIALALAVFREQSVSLPNEVRDGLFHILYGTATSEHRQAVTEWFSELDGNPDIYLEEK